MHRGDESVRAKGELKVLRESTNLLLRTSDEYLDFPLRFQADPRSIALEPRSKRQRRNRNSACLRLLSYRSLLARCHSRSSRYICVRVFATICHPGGEYNGCSTRTDDNDDDDRFPVPFTRFFVDAGRGLWRTSTARLLNVNPLKCVPPAARLRLPL